jgi:uncharacterized protein
VQEERGRSPRAEDFLRRNKNGSLEELAAFYVAEKEVLTVEDAIAGACDIIARKCSDSAQAGCCS